jgi:hypothetical protein
MARARTRESDEALLDRLQRSAFEYFLTHQNPTTGLVADRSTKDSPASIAVVGFALSAWPIGVERGWLSRAEAAERTRICLRFLEGSGSHGLFFHFLDLGSGDRAWTSELSTMDSGLLLAGALTAAAYFDGDSRPEREIRSLAEGFYRRADWRWATDGGPTLVHGWKPECGFLSYRWEGYNEGLLLYVLALGSPTHPLPAASYAAWTHSYQWENLYGIDFLFARALFMHQFSHAWLDLRGIRDRFMREKRLDYFENSRRAVAIQRAYATRNPHGFSGYDERCWGLTASEGPRAAPQKVDGVSRPFLGYTSRGVPFGPDDGTIAGCGALACVPFEPGASIEVAREIQRRKPRAILASGFNPSLRGWISPGTFGLDLGLLVLMIENHRTGLPWKLMRASPHVRRGLQRAGFTGGWL